MFKRLAGLLLIASLFSFVNARAADYKATFTASGFYPEWTGAVAPDSVVAGSIVFSALSANSEWDALKSIDLTIDGHRYELDEVGIDHYFGATFVGGKILNPAGVQAGADDFWLVTSDGGSYFRYATSSTNDIWANTKIEMSIVEVTAVPEPETYAMLLAGLGMMGVVARSRKS